jgi:hypothetical protein
MKIDILPKDVIAIVKAEGNGLEFGMIRLEIFLRDGKPRWEITRSRSIIDDTIQKGIDVTCLKTNKAEGAA